MERKAVLVDEEKWKKAKAKTALDGKSLSELVREAIDEYISEDVET